MEVVGYGKDGVVVFPPIACDISINPEEFVGKIYFKGKNPFLIKEKIDNLPDEYDGILYYKENYICSITLDVMPLPAKIYTKLSTNQLILKRVKGELLDVFLNRLVLNNNEQQMFDLLNVALRTFYMIKNLAKKKIYYDDFSTNNIIYDVHTKKLMLIDLDDITYGMPNPIPKKILYNERSKTYNTSYYYKGDMGYIHWYHNYTNNILLPIFNAILGAYISEEDDFILDRFDPLTRASFIRRRGYIENIIKKPYTHFTYKDIDTLYRKKQSLSLSKTRTMKRRKTY